MSGEDQNRVKERLDQVTEEGRSPNKSTLTFSFKPAEDHTDDLVAWMRDCVCALSPESFRRKKPILSPDALYRLTKPILRAAGEDLEMWRRSPKWPRTMVPLVVRVNDADPIDTTELALTIADQGDVVLLAGPGMGKTAVAFQVAQAVLDNTSGCPIVVPLAQWAAGGNTLLNWIFDRPAYRQIPRENVHEALGQAETILLLDGWNELDSVARRRALIEIQ